MAKNSKKSVEKYTKSAKYAAKMERYYHNLHIKRLAEERAEQEKNGEK